jgi:hypothetical protein
MTYHQSKNRPSIRRVIGGAFVASLLLGGLATSANAEDHRGGGDRHGGERHDDHRGGGDWGGRYHSAPPVVYGGSYYNPGYGYSAPPVVYGPAVGISTPGLSIGIN